MPPASPIKKGSERGPFFLIFGPRDCMDIMSTQVDRSFRAERRILPVRIRGQHVDADVRIRRLRGKAMTRGTEPCTECRIVAGALTCRFCVG